MQGVQWLVKGEADQASMSHIIKEQGLRRGLEVATFMFQDNSKLFLQVGLAVHGFLGFSSV